MTNFPRKPLSPAELEEQAQEIMRFLSAVHPSLVDNTAYKPCIELRPIRRGTQEFMLSKSLNLWDLSEQSQERLRIFLARHNGQQTCLYYSVFTFDNLAKATTAKGTAAKSGKITKATALFTEELALDFDNIGFDEYVRLVDAFEALGIYAYWVFTGHGYHAHILLDKPVSDKSLLLKAVYAFRAKGFDCDPACVDPARVMRLPATFNCKGFTDEAYAADKANPPYCAIMQVSEERYSFEYIMEQLESLETSNPRDAEIYESMIEKASAAPGGDKQAPAAEHHDEDRVTLSRIEYPYIADMDLPAPYEKMLAYTPHGFRNKVLGVLIKYFKSFCKLGAGPVQEIMTIWSQEACEPAYDPAEFKIDFKRLYYQYGGLGYDSSLVKQFGAVDSEQLIRLRKQDILLPRKFFDSFDKLDGKGVRLYLGIKMLEHMDEEPTQEALSKLLGISSRALRPTLQDLTERNFVYMKPGHRKQGIPNSYHSSLFATATEGYMRIGYNDVKAYVTELYEDGARGNGELKLFLFMRWWFWSGEIFMSQKNLGRHTGVAQQTVSDLVNRLQERHFIKIKKKWISAGMESCEYTLLR